MPTKHLKYGGSTMARTIACPGWIGLSTTLPKSDSSSEAAEMGTCLHDAMEWIMAPGEGRTPDDAECKTFNGLLVTEDMVEDSLYPAYEAVMGMFAKYDVKDYMLEPFVELIEDESGGSIDMLAVSGDGKTMIVIDYKFGFVSVPVEENKQLLFYALCADIDPSTEKMFKDVLNISLSIVQPSNPALKNGLDEWVTPVNELDDFEQRVVSAISAAESPGAKLDAGNHCRYCPAMAVCPIKTGEAQLANKLDEAHVDMLAEWLPRLDDIEDWIKSVKAMAATALENGTKIEGYKMVAKRATRQWTDAEGVSTKLKAMRGITGGEQYNYTLKSPAQMEKLFKAKKVDFDKITDYIASISSGSTMAKATDKRPEVIPIGAFKQAMQRLD